jgi:hypothetical protein
MGVPVKIDWASFKRGTSFFVPGTDQKLLLKQLRTEARRLNLDIVAHPVAEKGLLGVRVWRVS